MSQPTLKKSTQDVINPTGRMDIASSLLIYEAQVEGAEFRYKLTVRNWAKLLGNLKGRELLSLDFRVDNGPKIRVSVGRATDALKRAGEIRGSTILGDGVDPEAVSVTIIVSDPGDGHRIVARAFKAKVDLVVDDLDIELPDTVSKVRKLREVTGDALSLLDLRVSVNAKGKFSTLIDNVEMPTLLISPTVGKTELLEDMRLLCFALQATVRDILTAMAFLTDEYEDQPWFSKWKDFASKLSETGEWEHLADEHISGRERRARIDAAVAAFDDAHFSRVSFSRNSSDIQED